MLGAKRTLCEGIVLQPSGAGHFAGATNRLLDGLPESNSIDPFISYADNLEDVILWRALKNVDGGFYIDIGAGNPTKSSVTRSFYERGWRGINVEPSASNYDRLTVARPLDLNLPLLVRGRAGVVELFVSDDELIDSQELATQNRAEGRTRRRIAKPVTTLAQICEEHVTRAIHLLRINAEGSQPEILATMDFGRFRPWIVVILGRESNPECEETLRTAEYRFVYNDGLNRFYVPTERHAELAPQFATPPNVFDGFVRVSEWQARSELEKLGAEKLEFEQSLFESERYAGFLAAQRQKLLDEQQTLQQQIKKLKAAATSPFSRIMGAARRLMRRFKRV